MIWIAASFLKLTGDCDLDRDGEDLIAEPWQTAYCADIGAAVQEYIRNRCTEDAATEFEKTLLYLTN